MALRVAVANGNWSNPSTWNAGIIPVAGDIAASNGFTVTIDQNVNVDSITNAVASPVKVTPNMTGYTTPSGIVTASSDNTAGGRAIWQAFDGSGTIGSHFNFGPGWVAYEFPTPKIINAYSWSSSANEQPYNWTFEGWDGTSWIVLHTVTSGAVNYTSPLIGNNTAYIKYRINVSLVQISTSRSLWYEINLFEKGSDLTAVAGGSFNLNSGVTVTCTGTNGITGGPVTCMTYSGTGSSTINANITPTGNDVNAPTLIHNSTGTLILNGSIFNNGNSFNNRVQTVLFSGAGIFNITGTINGLQTKTGLNITGNGTCNIVGDLYPANAGSAMTIAGNAIVNITGNIYPSLGGSVFNGTLIIPAVSAVVTFTGNVFYDSNVNFLCNGIYVTGNSRLNVIGNVYAGSGSTYTGISATGSCYIDMVGIIKPNRGLPAFYSTGAGAINVLSGPFISGDSGVQPFYIARMHYRRTMGSYFEFRDNSTNGALPPAGAAPATRLVAPGTAVDAPSPANVRFGTSYALGAQTGTMIVPSPSNVAKNVPVDNTVGTAILDADSVWAVPLTSINTLNSIGRRVKNAATVETTGAQIQTTLNNNE
jgi:hypothetical protein